jgi:8-oxo-dGTP pyrophosphatase MutT (NUDIX family)
MKNAVAVVVKKGDKFLLIKRAKRGMAEDYWCPVTGAVERGESQKQAVVREAKEEMGIVVKPIRKVWECPTDDQQYILHWWFVKLISEDIKVNPDEVKKYRWVNCDQMQNIRKMFKADRQFFKEIDKKLNESTG